MTPVRGTLRNAPSARSSLMWRAGAAFEAPASGATPGQSGSSSRSGSSGTGTASVLMVDFSLLSLAPLRPCGLRVRIHAGCRTEDDGERLEGEAFLASGARREPRGRHLRPTFR